MKKILLMAMIASSLSAAAQDKSDNFEKGFVRYGLVNIADVDNTICVELKYSTTDNFMKTDMYGSLEKAYFIPEIAQMLGRAQQKLKAIHPDYSLVIYDAARPLSIQEFMYNSVAGTPNAKYVANPKSRAGYHNYGIAVDLSIVDGQGKALDMGSPFDGFDSRSHIGHEAELVAEGRITKEAMQNRALLVDIMRSVGFKQISTEWWHFQKYTKEELIANFKILDF